MDRLNHQTFCPVQELAVKYNYKNSEFFVTRKTLSVCFWWKIKSKLLFNERNSG